MNNENNNNENKGGTSPFKISIPKSPIEIFKTIFIALAFFTLLIVFSVYFFDYVYKIRLISNPCELCLKNNEFLAPCFKNEMKYIYDFKEKVGGNLDRYYNISNITIR